MRYLRKLAPLTLIALAMTASVASTATANVTVTNYGPFAIEEGSRLQTSTLTQYGHMVHFDCEYQADGYVNYDGSVAIENINFGHGSSTNCEFWNDCANNGWTGQIVGPGHPDYLGVADFEAVMAICVHGGGMGSEPFEARLHINGDIEDQQWSWPKQQVFYPAYNIAIDPWVGSEPFVLDRTDFEIALEE